MTREVVTDVLSMGDQSPTARPSHPGLVVPTTELIEHDLYVQEMLDAHRDTLEASRGRFEGIGEAIGSGGEVDGAHSSG